MDSIFNSLDDLFIDENDFDFAKESKELSIMEHLLYGYCYVKSDDSEELEVIDFTTEEWLDLWKTYLEMDKENQAIWEFKYNIPSWIDVERILKNLEQLKRKDNELFQQAFTGNFVSCLLKEIIDNNLLNKTRTKKLANWIQKNKVEEFDQKDFWRVAKHFYGAGFQNKEYVEVQKNLVEYSKLWRACTLKPIFISMKDEVQKKTFINNIQKSIQHTFFDHEKNIRNLLSVCDGVVDYDRFTDAVWVEIFLNSGYKELLYQCAQKNFLNKRMAKSLLNVVVKKQEFELIPLFMLKVHDKWPEGMIEG